MLRRWGGTISAKMGLLQAGAAQLISTPMSVSRPPYTQAIAVVASYGKPCRYVVNGTWCMNGVPLSLLSRCMLHDTHQGMTLHSAGMLVDEQCSSALATAGEASQR